MGFIADLYPEKFRGPLLTDKYHLSTLYAYWLEGRADNPSTFYMFGRKEAKGSGYTLFGGLEGIVDIVKTWQKNKYTERDINYIRSLRTPSGKQQFPEEFIDYLKTIDFKVRIDAADEGTAFFPQEPVIRVHGRLSCAKPMESFMLGMANGHSGWLTHAAREHDAATKALENGSPKSKSSTQGLRRSGLGNAIESIRTLGFLYDSTSTGTAAQQYGQPFAGTMDHAWVMTHTHELGNVTLAQLYKYNEEGNIRDLRKALKDDAFRSFVFAFPETGILLLDTYDPKQGLEKAITVFKEMKALGMPLNYGVRYDDRPRLVADSRHAMRRFAEEGFFDGLSRGQVDQMTDDELLLQSHRCTLFVAAADELNEFNVAEMRQQGAFVRALGLGTSSAMVPSPGLVYKNSEIFMDVLDGQDPDTLELDPSMKVIASAPFKSSNPGFINSRHYYGTDGKLSHVILFDERLGFDKKSRAVNARDFTDKNLPQGTFTTRDTLKPLFDMEDGYVGVDLPQKENFPGSGEMITDSAAVAKIILAEMDTLPEDIRIVARPQEEALAEKLVAAFKKAQKDGQNNLNLDIQAIAASLPKQPGQIPVYLDQNLYERRVACEKKHLNHRTAAPSPPGI